LPPFKTMEIGLTQHYQIPLDRGNSLEWMIDGKSFELCGSSTAELLQKFNSYLWTLTLTLLSPAEGELETSVRYSIK
jgi:hypothetical protein